MDLVFDIETDGLDATKVWCLVAQDAETKEVYKFTPDNLDEGYRFLTTATRLIGHNIIGFDIPLVEKFAGIDLSNKEVIDTLVLSRLFNPTRDGGHSLATWGYKLGYPKIEFEDYYNYSEEMLTYCVRDVELNTKVFEELRKESKGFTLESISLEQDVAGIVKQQETDGFNFDMPLALGLLAELRQKKQVIEEEVHETFKPKWVDTKQVSPYIKKDGNLSKRGMTDEEYQRCLDTDNYNPFMRQTLQEFNLGSRKQIGEYLIDFGWKPDRFTPTGQPIVDEKTLSKITHIHEAKLIADFLLLQKRIAQIDSWVEAVKDDGRVHGFVIPNGTITGRMAHRNPNVAQVPSHGSPYGKECRSCWIVEDGYKLVGVDASGLELRMLAHYMDDKEYINEIINGDIHTANQNFAGLKSRDQAKTFIYALVYGAGDEKIGSIIKGSRAEGKRLRERFLNSLPAYRTLKERVDRAASKTYLKGIDGRKLYIRHKHAALNTLLQGAGAVLMKKALVMLDDLLKLNTIDYRFVANIHDEWQIEVKESQTDFVGEMAVKCIIEAGEHFNLRCPMDGEYKVGGNWSETH
jgi:DNA polymerase I-like protein with 3'-5' exonuclease and polymerase domains